MYRALIKTGVGLGIAAAIFGGGAWWWHATSDNRVIQALEQQNQKLQQQKQQLEQVVSRLGEGKRVADLIVTEQTQQSVDQKTVLLFVEYDRNGKPLSPRQFEIAGQMAHVEAMVIEFDRDHVVRDDPLRGHAIALFTRIFGENQSPASGARIDVPGKVPAFYQSAEPALAEFEKRLWGRFWQLESDENLRKEMGVRVAIGKGVWGPFVPDTLYTITLTPDGNLSRTAEPIRGVYQQYIQALKEKLAASE